MKRFCGLVLPLRGGFASLAQAAEATSTDAFPVTIRVDAAKTNCEMKPIWRLFGADEPNCPCMTNGRRLIGGELDRNVDPASTMQVANTLVKADKDFDLLGIPDAGHGSAETAYGKRRRADYFVRHLLGVEPRSQP